MLLHHNAKALATAVAVVAADAIVFVALPEKCLFDSSDVTTFRSTMLSSAVSLCISIISQYVAVALNIIIVSRRSFPSLVRHSYTRINMYTIQYIHNMYNVHVHRTCTSSVEAD